MSVFPGTRREVKELIVKRRKKKKKIRERVSRKKATLKAMLMDLAVVGKFAFGSIINSAVLVQLHSR